MGFTETYIYDSYGKYLNKYTLRMGIGMLIAQGMSIIFLNMVFLAGTMNTLTNPFSNWE